MAADLCGFVKDGLPLLMESQRQYKRKKNPIHQPNKTEMFQLIWFRYISVANPDSGSGAFLTPGSGIWDG